ncbi:MAG: vWA domain-containing protein [Gammaproteobacteria bacterium]
MRRRRREFSAISLSFLDIMSCGFGAVVLLFLIIKHQTDVAVSMPAYDLDREVRTLQAEIDRARARRDELAERADDSDADLAAAQEAAEEARAALTAARAETRVPGTSGAREREALRASLRRTEQEKRALEAEIHARSKNVRTFVGEGNREYLTGIQLGGQRILILLDTSASMLDESIVNVIRRRNMSDDAKRRSTKWRQALATVDWITARFPAASRYQIYTFDTAAEPALPATRGQWLAVSAVDRLNEAVATLKQRIPAGGSSLERAFMVMQEMDPPPDNVYLITDGLPTQGLAAPSGSTVSGRERLRLFETAVARIPRGIPINVVLLPMEGDPMAPSAFWQIALYTRGAFLSPASDWP